MEQMWIFLTIRQNLDLMYIQQVNVDDTENDEISLRSFSVVEHKERIVECVASTRNSVYSNELLQTDVFPCLAVPTNTLVAQSAWCVLRKRDTYGSRNGKGLFWNVDTLSRQEKQTSWVSFD